MEVKLCFLLICVLLKGSEGTDAMKYLASGFVKVLDECKAELNLNDKLFSDLYHYWKLDYSHLTRDTGCAIICMSKKLDLIDDTGKLHHGNAQEYAEKHGAESELAQKLVTEIHNCEKQYETLEDQCLRILDVAKCFRTRLHDLNWAPKVDVIISEVLTEI